MDKDKSVILICAFLVVIINSIVIDAILMAPILWVGFGNKIPFLNEPKTE